MYRTLTHISLILLVLSAASCQSDKALTVANQESAIDSYIQSNYKDSTIVRNGGSSRVVISPGDSTIFAAGNDSVTFVYDGYIFSKGISESNLFAADSVTISLSDKDIVLGLRNGLTGTCPGEVSLILFSSKYGFYDQSVGLVPGMSSLAYIVGIVSIKKTD